MNWEYQIIRADNVEHFEAAPNKVGREGWEAIAGNYAVGESKKTSLGHGMPATTTVGAPVWAAIMKRPLKGDPH